MGRANKRLRASYAAFRVWRRGVGGVQGHQSRSEAGQTIPPATPQTRDAMAPHHPTTPPSGGRLPCQAAVIQRCSVRPPPVSGPDEAPETSDGTRVRWDGRPRMLHLSALARSPERFTTLPEYSSLVYERSSVLACPALLWMTALVCVCLSVRTYRSHDGTQFSIAMY